MPTPPRHVPFVEFAAFVAALNICFLGTIRAGKVEFRDLVEKMETDVLDLASEVERAY